ncbi:MAG TPA: LacI family DNA-binding transcriptional regulator [Chthoniobacteraceae bacterium]|nr:LacI family DNA-binding transcriptional regulator [Chthoniobacteraceae bacterium]
MTPATTPQTKARRPLKPTGKRSAVPAVEESALRPETAAATGRSTRVTQKTIATALGLSPSTVGLVLGSCTTREGKKLAPETVARIEAKARELGYHPNRAAQSIRTGRSNLIGVVHFGGVTEIGLRANRALASEIAACGYRHLAVDLSWHGNCVDRALRELIQAGVEAVVVSLITEAFQAEHTEMLLKAGIPVISVNGDPRMNMPLVCDDVENAFAALTTHAREEGHQKLLLVIHDAVNRPMKMRQAGFEHGLKGERVVVFENEAAFDTGWPEVRATPGTVGTVVRIPHKHQGNEFRHDLYRMVLRLAKAGELPDALFCTSDSAAFGVFAAAAECGVRIPEDLAVIGWGNYDYGSYPAYSLTTVNPNIERSCRAAIGQLVDHLRDSASPMEDRLFEGELIVRNSSGRRSAPRPALPSL